VAKAQPLWLTQRTWSTVIPECDAPSGVDGELTAWRHASFVPAQRWFMNDASGAEGGLKERSAPQPEGTALRPATHKARHTLAMLINLTTALQRAGVPSNAAHKKNRSVLSGAAHFLDCAFALV
jgi:hypothetical protein